MVVKQVAMFQSGADLPLFSGTAYGPRPAPAPEEPLGEQLSFEWCTAEEIGTAEQRLGFTESGAGLRIDRVARLW